MNKIDNTRKIIIFFLLCLISFSFSSYLFVKGKTSNKSISLNESVIEYVPYGDYVSVSSVKKINKFSKINWQIVGSNPNIDLTVFAMSIEEFEKFEIDKSSAAKMTIYDGLYYASGVEVVPFRALWVVVVYNNDPDMMGINLTYDITFENKPINHWFFTGPAIAIAVFGIAILIYFYARNRKMHGLPFFPQREQKEKAKKTTKTFRPPLTNFFRILGVLPMYSVTNSCIMGCCCCMCNIAFYLILGVVIFPFWLFFRLFIFVRIDEEQIIMKTFRKAKIVPFTDIVNISIQGKSSRQVTTKRKGMFTETSEGPVTPHSVTLLFKTHSQALVIMDLDRYSFNKGLKITEYLMEKIERKQIIPISEIDNQLFVLDSSVDFQQTANGNE